MVYHGQIDRDTRCVYCKMQADGWSSPDPDSTGPEDGDVALCVYCGGLNEFVTVDSQLTMRAPPLTVLMELMNLLPVQQAYKVHERYKAMFG